MDPAAGLRRFPLSPHQLTDVVTPADDLFVLTHLGVPRVDPEQWSLTLDGLVERPLNLADLTSRPKIIVEASAEHGFPVRLVAPGFYGTNSVNWLWRLRLADERAPAPSRPS